MKNLSEGSPNVASAASSNTPPQTISPVGNMRMGVLVRRSLTLMKPVTWFAPAWAFLCGALASGSLTWSPEGIGTLLLGILMAGPLLCGLSQVVNDYCDSEVDAINEPNRLIPAGLVTRRHVHILAFLLLAVGSIVALSLGRTVALLVGIGLLFAIAYSMKPFRAKRNGWVGNALVSFSYEGLAWLAGHVAFAMLSWPSFILAALYSIGAHGIMTVNDFKSMEGDTRMGLRSIPVMYGKQRAAWLVVLMMSFSQVAVISLLFFWGHLLAAAGVGLLLLLQTWPFVRFIRDPENNAVFFNATAIMLFVWGMLIAAIGVAG